MADRNWRWYFLNAFPYVVTFPVYCAVDSLVPGHAGVWRSDGFQLTMLLLFLSVFALLLAGVVLFLHGLIRAERAPADKAMWHSHARLGALIAVINLAYLAAFSLFAATHLSGD